jgi:hypothetical protein
MGSQALLHTLIFFFLSAEPVWAASSEALKSQEVCTGDTIQLNRNETVVVKFKSGCTIDAISFLQKDVEETATWPSGRTTKFIRKHPTGNFSYPEWPPSVISFKAITPARISFLAPKTTPVRQPPKSLTALTQAQSQAQPKPLQPSTSENIVMVIFLILVQCGVIYVIIRLMKRSSPVVKDNWGGLIENLQASPKEFYASVEEAIEKRQVPAISNCRVEWKEGGLFTSFREYLRISREKHIFDICAAPYGTGFFVSWWLAELQPSAIGPTLAAIWIILFIDSTSRFLLDHPNDYIVTGIVVILIFLFVGILINRSAGANWVRYVLVIPVIGRLMTHLFMPPTYYRIDTASMFQLSMKNAVDEVIKQLMQARGLRAITELEGKPILREFFQK